MKRLAAFGDTPWQDSFWQVTRLLLDEFRRKRGQPSPEIDVWEIRRQREYTPEGWRRVED